ncbi:acyl-homoserine-lactone synthase [Agrobacterium radiobacter]|uniref:acyl-homoserine-lactone synthase n=1 Tax=Agrobacterium radiobacter TaxID=362 RepID=UPI003F85AFF1
MFKVVQAYQYERYSSLLAQYFALRRRVFIDELGWSITACGGYEKDFYDGIGPAYLFWCDEDSETLYGGVRLLPTTGPTLLYDVFRDTFPDAADLIAPDMWEATRVCIDTKSIATDLSLAGSRAFSVLLLALFEFALDNGIHTLISNYEPPLRRIYRRAGLVFEEMGQADGYGRHPVCCGAFEVSPRVLIGMRAAVGIKERLFVNGFPHRFATIESEVAA